MKAYILILYCLLSAASFTWSQEIVMVTHPQTKISTLSKSEIKRIYLGKSNYIQNTELKVINQSQKSPLSQIFLKQYLKMNQQKFIKWWLKQQIIGRARPPILTNNDQEVINNVLKETNIIGYIDKKNLTDKLKVVEVR